MASITNKSNIFFVTSPRTPDTLIPEIDLLVKNFTGQIWNPTTQTSYYEILSDQDYFKGSKTGDLAFKARDRITRAPKALGFVDLKPKISLTSAGQAFLYSNRGHESLLRQLIKFQLHSPYHIDKNDEFNVRPYFELIKLIYELEGISKNEIAIFFMGLKHHQDFEKIKSKIEQFRVKKSKNKNIKKSYKQFIAEEFEISLSEIYKKELSEGKISLRENTNENLKKFFNTKKRNHLDYADAAIRYLRATRLFSFDSRSSKVYIPSDSSIDIEFILENNKSSIYSYSSESDYKQYLFNEKLPQLYTDNKSLLIQKIENYKNSDTEIEEISSKSIEELKDIKDELVNSSLDALIKTEQALLSTYKNYDDVIDVFSKIQNKDIVDPPLQFEWNVWRALSMLNDGKVVGNFKIDDFGNPYSTAPPKKADIECFYENFSMTVEVSLSTGHKQYEQEGEPVARHFGDFKKSLKKDSISLCVFIAPKISDATLAYYFTLYSLNISFYGGTARIVPISLENFKILLKNAAKNNVKPNSTDIQDLLEDLCSLVKDCSDEKEWSNKIDEKISTAFL